VAKGHLQPPFSGNISKTRKPTFPFSLNYLRENVPKNCSWRIVGPPVPLFQLQVAMPRGHIKFLTLSPPNKLASAKFLICFDFQCYSQSVKMLSESQTAWVPMRRRVTRRLIRTQAVCIWDYVVIGGLRVKPSSME